MLTHPDTSCPAGSSRGRTYSRVSYRETYQTPSTSTRARCPTRPACHDWVLSALTSRSISTSSSTLNRGREVRMRALTPFDDSPQLDAVATCSPGRAATISISKVLLTRGIDPGLAPSASYPRRIVCLPGVQAGGPLAVPLTQYSPGVP